MTDTTSADAAYIEAAVAADQRITRIIELLDAHDQSSRPRNWAHVGDLNAVNASLAEVIAHLDGDR